MGDPARSVAEAPARDPYYPSHGFDAAYDWGDELGHWAWKDVFQSQTGIASRLHDALMRTTASAPRPERVLRFLNNNDTGARFITRYGEEMTRVATVALLTLPGIPCLFTFDEVGAEYEPYAGLASVRPPARPALRDFYENLIRLRRATAALHGKGFTPLPLDPALDMYAYARQGARPEHAALVALHFGAASGRVQLKLPRDFPAGRRAALRDLLTGRTFRTRAGQLDLALGPHETLILVPE